MGYGERQRERESALGDVRITQRKRQECYRVDLCSLKWNISQSKWSGSGQMLERGLSLPGIAGRGCNQRILTWEGS